MAKEPTVRYTIDNVEIELTPCMGEGETGWRVRTWTEPSSPSYLESEVHWVYAKAPRPISRLVEAKLSNEEFKIKAERKRAIHKAIARWEKERTTSA
jgi:hypothetical protein